MSEKLEGNLSPKEQNEPIDVDKDPFAYNKDFDPSNPEHFTAWVKMRPKHISEAEWPIKVAELKEMLTAPSVKNEHDRSMVMLGWKSKNGLLPEQK